MVFLSSFRFAEHLCRHNKRDGPMLTLRHLCPIWRPYPSRLSILVNSSLSILRWAQLFPSDTFKERNGTHSALPFSFPLMPLLWLLVPETLPQDLTAGRAFSLSLSGGVKAPGHLSFFLAPGLGPVGNVPSTRCTSPRGSCAGGGGGRWDQREQWDRGWVGSSDQTRLTPGVPRGGNNDIFSGVFSLFLGIVPVC